MLPILTFEKEKYIKVDFITWCNDNSGFMSAVLSLIGLVVSGFAIGVSLYIAGIPYRKKLKLGIVDRKIFSSRKKELPTGDIHIHCVNVGSRDIFLTRLGICAKRNSHSKNASGIVDERYPIDGVGVTEIAPAKVIMLYLQKERLSKSLAEMNRKDKIYLYARDSEGKEYYKRIMNYNEFAERYLKN